MYSYEDRLRAVRLYLKLGKRIRATIRQLGYCRRQWQYLIRYVDDGRLPIDNNVIERDIRPFAISRSFCPYRAGSRSPLSLASAVRTSRQGQRRRTSWRKPSHPRGDGRCRSQDDRSVDA